MIRCSGNGIIKGECDKRKKLWVCERVIFRKKRGKAFKEELLEMKWRKVKKTQ